MSSPFRTQAESTLKALTAVTPGFSGVALRIGWCQPGANMPDTMSATGTPTVADDAADAGTGYSDVALGFDDEAKVLPWFENMWFSNRDMLQCVERCVDYEADEFKAIFGMSANSNMRWGTPAHCLPSFNGRSYTLLHVATAR